MRCPVADRQPTPKSAEEEYLQDLGAVEERRSVMGDIYVSTLWSAITFETSTLPSTEIQRISPLSRAVIPGTVSALSIVCELQHYLNN